MVIFKGNKRIFDKIIQEENSSTTTAKVISIYGVTSYSDIENVPIQIKAITLGEASATLNVNNLGAKAIKVSDDGPLINVLDGWVSQNQIYTVVYMGGYFVLATRNSNFSRSNILYGISNISGLLALTSSSTQAQIEAALDNDVAELINTISENVLLVAQTDEQTINIDYKLYYTGGILDRLVFEFIYNGDYYKQDFVADNNGDLISVTVTKNSVIIEDNLVSNSHSNSPSVYAVNEALGQIDTLLNQILGS